LSSRIRAARGRWTVPSRTIQNNSEILENAGISDRCLRMASHIRFYRRNYR
jgi:hypothetical protein